MTKKIAIITELLTISGTDRQIDAICTYFTQRGYTITIYSVLPRSNSSIVQPGPGIEIVYSRNWTPVLFICGVIRYIPDILKAIVNGLRDTKLHANLLSIKSNLIETRYINKWYSKKILRSITWEPFAAVIGLHFQVRPLLYAIQQLGIPTRYIEISSPKWRALNGFRDGLLPHVINTIDRIIVPFELIGEELKTYEGLQKPYVVIPLVLSMPEYHSRSDRPVSTFGVATRLSREKNLDLLIRVMGIIKTKNAPIKLVLIGDGAEKKNLLRLRKDLSLEDDVVFTGPFARVEQFIDQIDIATLLSDVESTPATLLEALYFGKPIIATDVGSVSSIVIDGFNGYIVDKNNMDDVAEKIVTLTDRGLYDVFSQNSRTLYDRIYRSKDILAPLEV